MVLKDKIMHFQDNHVSWESNPIRLGKRLQCFFICLLNGKVLRFLLNRIEKGNDMSDIVNVAIEHDDEKLLEAIIDRGYDPNTMTTKGWSPLLRVILKFSDDLITNENAEAPKCFKFLIENNADVNAKNPDGETPLLVAVKNEALKLVELFLANGADVNTKDYNGKSPLHWALTMESKEIVKLLLDHKADVNSRYDEQTPLQLASYNGSLGFFKVLIENCAEVNAQHYYGMTPLLWAIHGGNLDILKLLIDNGAEVNAQDDNGITPLCFAKIRRNEEIIKCLLENGADANDENHRDVTPLQ